MITFYILSLIISKYFVIDQLYFSLPVFRFYYLETLFPVSLDNSHLSILWKVVCNNAGCIYNQLFIEKLGFIYSYSDKIKILLFSLLVFCGSLFFIFYKNKKKHSNNSFNNELTPSKSSDLYSDFAPIDLGEDDEHYEQIKFALEDENVKNLAILGSFGSGKSSVINSFFKNKAVYGSKIQPDEYVKVSFADFDYVNLNEEHPKNSQSSDNGKKSKEKVIREDDIQNNDIKSSKLSLQDVEGEIIRQLFHSNLVKNNKFADAILSYPSKVDIFVQTFILFVLIIGIFCKPLRDSYYSLYSTSIYLFCFTSILFIPFLYLTISFFSKKIKLSKTSFGTVSVDFSEKNKLGVIDCYLNDIIYLFENSNCKYVILEDLDRTQNYEVFTHLRNLNFVLNNRVSSFTEKRSQRSRIVFIYLLDDRIFSDPYEQVKFFDYSLTVVPVLSLSTSGKQMIEKRNKYTDHKINTIECENFIINDYFSKDILPDTFLLSISKYITDKRLINKIFNDYILYLHSFKRMFDLFNNQTDKENYSLLIRNLFALTVFHCICPREYGELLLEKGFVYCVLNRDYKMLGFSSKNREKSDLQYFSFKEVMSYYDVDLSEFRLKYGNHFDFILYLLRSESLSRCYRFFTSNFFSKNIDVSSSKKEKNNSIPSKDLSSNDSNGNLFLSDESIRYLIELNLNKNKYFPGRKLSLDEHFHIFFFYLPKFSVYNKTILNFELISSLFKFDDEQSYSDFIDLIFGNILTNYLDDCGYSFLISYVKNVADIKFENDKFKSLLNTFFIKLCKSYFDVASDATLSDSKNPTLSFRELFLHLFNKFDYINNPKHTPYIALHDALCLFIFSFLFSYNKEIILLYKDVILATDSNKIQKISKVNDQNEKNSNKDSSLQNINLQNRLNSSFLFELNNRSFLSPKSLELLKKYQFLISDSFFSSMFIFNLHFNRIPVLPVDPNAEVKDEDREFFYKFFNLAIYRPDEQLFDLLLKERKCYFCFSNLETSFVSFAHSIDYLYSKNSNNNYKYYQDNKVDDKLITILLEEYDDNLSQFYINLFYHIFVYKEYDILFRILNIEKLIPEITSEMRNTNLVKKTIFIPQYILKDKLAPFILFITFIVYYSSNSPFSYNFGKFNYFKTTDIYSKEFHTNFLFFNSCFPPNLLNLNKFKRLTKYEAIIYFLLALENFSDSGEKGAFNLYFKYPELGEINNLNCSKNNFNCDGSTNCNEFHVVHKIKEIFSKFSRVNQYLFSSDQIDLALIRTFSIILNYETVVKELKFERRFKNQGIFFNDCKLLPNISNVLYIGQYLIHISKLKKMEFSCWSDSYHLLDECWSRLADFYKNHYDQIYKSNLEHHICDLNKSLDKLHNDPNKLKDRLKQICEQANITFFS